MNLGEMPIRGEATAPVALIEFSEFQCPYCRRFAAETLPIIEREYVNTGKLVIAFRHLPLQSIHPYALGAATAAECADAAGKFWPMHDSLFQDTDLTEENLLHKARGLGLDGKKFADCLRRTPVTQIQRDIDLAKSLNITGTPTFLLGRRLPNGDVRVEQAIRGASTPEQMRQGIDKLLAAGSPV